MFVMRHEARLTHQTGWQSFSPIWAWASFAAYLAWNIKWLASGKIPPSALRILLGVPCPTTGCTRSLVSLLHGDLYASLLWNPFMVPILILSGVSLQMLSLAALRKKELALPKWMGIAWLNVLIVAWLSKFLIGRAYW
jgi:hypothetical protein